MTVHIAKRVAQGVLLIVVLLLLVFIGGRAIGDPISALAPPGASEQTKELMRISLGFDRSLWDQFIDFVSRIIRLDFGDSMWRGTPALDIVLERLPNTLILAGAAIAIALPISLVLGSVAALHPGSRADRIVSIVSLSGVSMVDFWLGLILIGTFSVQLGWLPTGGMGGIEALILPAVTLSYRSIGRLTQFTRSALVEELNKPYIKMARSKGIPEWRVFLHALKNASVSVVTMLGDETAAIANGSMVVETVFAWPGLGSLIIGAITMRDLFLLEATVFVAATLILSINLLVDLSYERLNPRIRYA